MRQLAFILCLASLAAGQVSLETRNISGTVYYVAHNDGGISNWSYANYTLGQFATTEGQGDELAAWRMSQYNFSYGLALLNANGTISRTVTTDWTGFVTGGVSDNATYWKTWAGRTIGQMSLNFTNQQNDTDDYILERLTFDGNLQSNRDVYLMVKFDSTYFDSVTYSNGSTMSNFLLNRTTPGVFWNWTYLAMVHSADGWGWQFMNNTDLAKALVVYNHSVYMLFLLGRNVDGVVDVNYWKIDINPCQVTCGGQPADAATVAHNNPLGFTGQQVGYGKQNATFSTVWTDTYNSCSLAFCALGPLITDPFNRTINIYRNVTGQWYTSIGKPASWMVCNQDNPGGANCTYGNGVAAVNAPSKNYFYEFPITEAGRFNIALFTHSIRACLFTNIAGLGSDTPQVGVQLA